MESRWTDNFVELDLTLPVWDRFYMVAPLVVIGTKELEGYDLAPKHMAMPLGWSNYFGFVCTPRHKTYHNAKHTQAFTVSFPNPDQVLLAGLAATPRVDKPGHKPIVEALETLPARVIDGVLLQNSYLYLECNVDRIIDGFGVNSLIIGEVVAAYVHKDAVIKSDADQQQLLYQAPLLAYLPPGRFATIRETIAFPFPVDFEK